MSRSYDYYWIPPQEGLGFIARKDSKITITDIRGGQVIDFTCFGLTTTLLPVQGSFKRVDEGEYLYSWSWEENLQETADITEYFSAGRTIDMNQNVAVNCGRFLWSNLGRRMAMIVEDQFEHHDLLHTPCSQQTFDVLYPDVDGHHRSCLENLTEALIKYGVKSWNISSTFNINMNTQLSSDGRITYGRPLNKPGTYIKIRPLIDLAVGISACPSGHCNYGKAGPVSVEVGLTNE